MGRVTRKKAAEIAEQLHIDEDAVLDMSTEDTAVKAKLTTPEPTNRSPLGEIEPNSADSRSQEEEPIDESKRSTRGRKTAKKGGPKAKKTNLAASTRTLPEESDVVPDDNESASSPASEKATEELSSVEPELQRPNVELQDRSQSPPGAVVRVTRSQLTKRVEADDELRNTVDASAQRSEELEGYFHSNDTLVIETETSEPTDMSETANVTVMDAPISPLPSAVPNVIKTLRSDTPGKRSTSNKENVQPELETNSMASPRVQSSAYDVLEDAVVAAATPPRSEPHASPRPEDPITALDDLEDAVENVNRDIPEIQTSPEKAKKKATENIKSETVMKDATRIEETKPATEQKPEAKKESKKAAPVVRTTKAAQARLSMAQNKDAASKAPTLGRPRPSMALGRSQSVRQSSAPKAEGTSKRVPSNPATTAATKRTSLKTSTNGEQPREKKETVIPHSKPRPISLSFPTPPPAAKSTKAPTQGTFQLPGEAVAAKLKAAREARMAKETEEAEKNKDKKPAFKARPAPRTTGTVPAVRQTNASRARESIVSGKPAATVTSHKRSNTVGATAPRPVVPKESSSTTAKPSTSTSKPRPSTSLASTTKPRASLAPARVPSSGTSKGKEVFSRAANAAAAAQKEKADKEAAAKKARAEAAERGRVASREWAEKQRVRKLGAKGKGAGVEGKGEEGAEEVAVA